MTIRVVVADRSAARFYDTERLGGALRLFDDLQHPQGRLQEHDLTSDRAGRVFDHAPPARGRRGTVPRHATGPERQAVHHETQVFARRIVEILWAAHGLGQFDRLVLIAEPGFLGVLRAELPKNLGSIIVATIGKDFLHESPGRVAKMLQSTLSRAGQPRAAAGT